MQNIQLKKISQIMEEYSPSYPQDQRWESTIEYLLHEPSDREIIEVLVNDLNKDGKFREPILAIEDKETGNKYIGDGTHRLIAAYIAGHDTILTADSYFNDSNEQKNFTTYIRAEKELSDDEIELMYGYLRSLRINDKVWITTCIVSYDCKEYSCYWDYEPNITIEEINESVKNTLKRILPHTVFTIETIIEEWEDEDTEAEKSIWDEEFNNAE